MKNELRDECYSSTNRKLMDEIIKEETIDLHKKLSRKQARNIDKNNLQKYLNSTKKNNEKQIQKSKNIKKDMFNN
jgi:hypothetical protein